MGWLIGIAIAGLVIGAGAAVVSGIQNNEALKNQKKAQAQKEKNDAIGYIGTDATTLQENLSVIQQYLETISGLESEISANEYNAGVNDEWLADYQAMLAGTTDKNNVFNNTLTELNARVDEATRRIRRMDDKKKANIPILSMTANAFPEDKIKALDAGMNGHVAKPFEITVLVSEMIEAILSGEN